MGAILPHVLPCPRLQTHVDMQSAVRVDQVKIQPKPKTQFDREQADKMRQEAEWHRHGLTCLVKI
jgi:hypothetical protein